ncbi:protein FAM151B isoform X2 [Chelmon rostratus]|uniref:protein FAM151B isoform X2 n=1 Tax=Chelmon rostratus TaxID=109905 RepID=UPI001BEB6A37|nr:protein FAM151B isoform X2 [Chelmon rostratus]
MKKSLLFSLRSAALLLIGCFAFYVVWNLKERMSEQTLEYFWSQGEIKRRDAAAVRWSHAVNSRSVLTEALSGHTHMIEADIIMRGRDPKEPIMAHPPDTDSDITLKEWLEGVMAHNKGIKLDFKSLEAVSPSVALLEEVLAETSHPVWVNADILSGPGGQARPLEPQAFLSAVGALPAHTVLSLGWTTGWTAGTENPGYSWDMVHMMEEICRTLKHPVTFPVRAALLAQSFSQLTWLLQQSDRYTLTVWTGQNDKYTVEDLLPYRKEFDTSRIYYDLPDPLRTELSMTLHDNN